MADDDKGPWRVEEWMRSDDQTTGPMDLHKPIDPTDPATWAPERTWATLTTPLGVSIGGGPITWFGAPEPNDYRERFASWYRRRTFHLHWSRSGIFTIDADGYDPQAGPLYFDGRRTAFEVDPEIDWEDQ